MGACLSTEFIQSWTIRAQASDVRGVLDSVCHCVCSHPAPTALRTTTHHTRAHSRAPASGRPHTQTHAHTHTHTHTHTQNLNILRTLFFLVPLIHARACNLIFCRDLRFCVRLIKLHFRLAIVEAIPWPTSLTRMQFWREEAFRWRKQAAPCPLSREVH